MPEMKPKPRVSIVLPVYNAERTLAATLDSVWAQTFGEFELLIVNDGSTDATGALLAGQSDPRLQVIGGRHGGASASRNRGVAQARGEFVAFLDGDDLWAADKLARQVAALEAAPDAALVYGWTDLIDESGRVIQQGSHVVANGRVYALLASRNFLDCGSTPLVRRSALLEAAALLAAGPFDESLQGGEDWDLWLRLAAEHAFVCVPAVQVHYRVHGSSAVSKVEQQVRDVRIVIARAVARLPASAERERIERTATANLYKYVAVRLARTGTTRTDGAQILRYGWQYLRTTPTLWRNLLKVALILGAGAALSLFGKKGTGP